MPQSATVHDSERLLWSIHRPWPSAPREYQAAIAPPLARIAYDPDSDAAGACRDAAVEIAVLGRGPAARLPGFQAFLERTESIASCRLDGVETDGAHLAQAQAGVPAPSAARAACAAATGLAVLLESSRRAVSAGAIAAAHQPPPSGETGWRDKVAHYRATQTWIGGTDLWPDGADYVPPQPGRVVEAMEDLIAFTARRDIDPIAQAALAHAQFLSIQPFSSGNGRTARALINAVLWHRGVTEEFAIPVSASIAWQPRAYAMDWKAYRIGDADAVVESIGTHLARAAKEAAVSADRLSRLPGTWQRAARPRSHSTAASLITLLVEHPIVDAADVQRLTGASPASAYGAIVTLAEAGVLRRLTRTRRDTVWAAADVIDESDRLIARLASS